MNADESLDLTIALPPRDPAALDLFLANLQNPKSPQYHHFLKPGEFAGQFGPAQEDYDAVAGFARSRGFSVSGTNSNRLMMNISGPAGAAEKAFGVDLNHYQDKSGRTFHAPDREPALPADIAARVTGIIGLDNSAQASPHIRKLTIGSPHLGSGPGYGMAPSDIKTAYNLNSVAATGSGQTLALFELDGYTSSDITAYENQFSLPAVPLQNVIVDSYSGAAGTGAAEVTLDIEVALAMAPGLSKILVYEAPNGSGILDCYTRIANDDLAAQVSTSWGIPEDYLTTAFVQAESTVFQQMAAQGQTIYAAAGDAGAFNDTNKPTTLVVDDPASQPYVTGVGGTQLTTGTGHVYASETTWYDTTVTPANGGGGGVSALWTTRPYYQNAGGGYKAAGFASGRNVPDVSFNADPRSGYSIYLGGWAIYGGTSAAAPLWASFTAMVNQQRAAVGTANLGFANPALYTLAAGSRYASDFHDIADNSNNGSFYAMNGYDNATGLGTMNGANLFADLTPATNPLASVISVPTVSASLSGLAQASGTATGTNLQSVSITLAKVDGSGNVVGYYNWTLGVFDTNKTPAAADITTASGTTNWTQTLPVAAILLPGPYRLGVYASDNSGHVSSTVGAPFSIISAAPLSATVAAPASNATYAGLSQASGGAAGAGLQSVNVELSKVDASGNVLGYYNWTSGAFDTNATPQAADITPASGTTSWTANLPPASVLTAGRYALSAYAADALSNKSPLATNIFTISAPNLKKATDIATAPDNTSRLMWTTPAGTVAVWTLDANGNPTSYGTNYGPYAGWTPRRISVGADGNTRLIWSYTDGRMAFWVLNSTGTLVNNPPQYGPFSGWSCIDVATSPTDNTSRILWTAAGGLIAVWNLDANGAFVNAGTNYGPIGGWMPHALSIGGDGKTRVLWNNVSGQMATWQLNAQGALLSGDTNYGPYSGWTCNDIATAPDNTSRLMWDNTGGPGAVWKLDINGAIQVSGGNAVQAVYGPFSGWTATALSVGADGKMRLLWDNVDGHAQVWIFDIPTTGNIATSPLFGPYVPGVGQDVRATAAAAGATSNLSVSTALASGSEVRLTFVGALDVAGAVDVSHFNVAVNGANAEVTSATYNAATFSVTLKLAQALQSGNNVSVLWQGLQDAKGNAVNGRQTLAAR